jgi:hypothetical protein
MRAATSLAMLALASCDRPATLLICHNGNCAEPTDPAKDDTIGAFQESLALELEGRPVIDGIEIDTFWRGSDDTCIFAHDLDNTENTPAIAPAQELATYFARPGPIGFADAPFEIALELKSKVDTDGNEHSPAQLALHAQCTWDLYTAITTAAVANNRTLRFRIGSFSPELIRAVIDSTPPATPAPFGFVTFQGIPPPLDPETRPLGDYRGLPIEAVEFHAEWILDAQYEAVTSAGQEVAFFMFSLTNESFYTIAQYDPVYVTTSEARLFRRWLAR